MQATLVVVVEAASIHWNHKHMLLASCDNCADGRTFCTAYPVGAPLRIVCMHNLRLHKPFFLMISLFLLIHDVGRGKQVS